MTTSNELPPHRTMFWGLMRAQLAATLVFALLAMALAGTMAGLVAAWGGTISLIAYAWAGFQLWLHPGNRALKRMATAAVRAEMGKIAIMLLLLGLSFKQWPELRDPWLAAALLMNFFLVQVVGMIWLARATGETQQGGASGKHDG